MANTRTRFNTGHFCLFYTRLNQTLSAAGNQQVHFAACLHQCRSAFAPRIFHKLYQLARVSRSF